MTTGLLTTTAHDVHGLTVEIAADDEAVGGAVRDRLRRFPPARRSGEAQVRFEYRRIGDDAAHVVGRPAGESRPVYDPPAGEVLHFPATDAFFIDYADRVRVLCEPAAGRAVVSYRSCEAANLWLLSRPMFTLPMLELAKRQGRFGLHAAAVARDGRGLLLPGASGSGKSTLAIALAVAGFAVLGDDLVFLRDAEALAFPDDVDVTPATAALFPGLEALAGPPEAGWPKRAVAPDSELGAAVVTSCRPAVLVFPSVAGSVSSELIPLAPAEALLRLAPDVFLTEPAATQAHLDALGRLVRRCSCWQLHTGRDLDRVPALLGAILR
jgi:hypothetical protein